MHHSYNEVLATFTDPPAHYRPMLFWIWNGELNREQVEAQVADMAQKGCGGFFIHPMGENFRLKDFVKGISPGYLSDGYFEAVRWAVEAAVQHGLYAWLYDEGGWPSGTAQGKVLEGHPEHRAQVLSCRHLEVSAGEQLPADPDTVAWFAVFEGKSPQLLDGSDGAVVPEDCQEVLAFVVRRIEGRTNLLSPATVRRFLDVTHERYAQAVGEYFGNTIPGMFTDEPAVAGRVASGEIPWTDDMLEAFGSRKGFDVRPLLPALFSREAVGAQAQANLDPAALGQIRCAFYDVWTDLYHEAYWLQINRWCEDHRLIHTGHVGGEDNLLDHARHGFGHYFKTAGSLHSPGVDAIWRQLCWNKDNFGFPQFAASAAHQRPGQGGSPEEDSPFDNLVITETNGVYGAGLTYEQMRWLVDYQCLRGINLIAPMAYSYDTSEGRVYRTQDQLGPGSPQWSLYRGLADYVGRLCAILRRGVSLADTAVYYPIEGVWADPDSETAQQTWVSLQLVTRALNEEQVAFDFIDARAIESGAISEGALETPGENYSTIIVPDTGYLPLGVLNRLGQLYEQGGRVVFLGDVPARCSDYGVDGQYQAAANRLAAISVPMDLTAETELPAGDTRGGLNEAARWDGLAAGLAMPRSMDAFPAAVTADKVVLRVPEEEIGRLARVLALRVGRFSLQAAGVEPDLRMMVRDLDPLQVAFAMNESQEPLEVTMEVVSELPSLLERWYPVDGAAHLLAVHEEVSEITRTRLRLRPGESAILVLVPKAEAPEATSELEPKPRHPVLEVILEALDEPDSISIVEQYELTGGDVRVTRNPSVKPPTHLGTWGDFELGEFCGTIAYEYSFTVAAEYLGEEVFLDLGEVCYAARVVLNGTELAPCLWRPYVLEVGHQLREHDNLLRVEVSNTLANQVASPLAVEEAQRKGWFNTYYERSLPMMRESLRSGLIGPVRLYMRG